VFLFLTYTNRMHSPTIKTTHSLFLEGVFLRKPQLSIVRIVFISQVRVTTMLALLSTSSYEIGTFGAYSEEKLHEDVSSVNYYEGWTKVH
jgi:hypothetical protein